MAKKSASETNLPQVSKQTAGGVTGAVIGGVVGGPVGAVAGGVAGALIGDASAKGNRPIKKAVEAIRSKLGGGKPTKAVEVPKASSRTTKTSKKGTARKKKVAASARPPKKSKSKPAKKKAASAAKSKVASTAEVKANCKTRKEKAITSITLLRPPAVEMRRYASFLLRAHSATFRRNQPTSFNRWSPKRD